MSRLGLSVYPYGEEHLADAGKDRGCGFEKNGGWNAAAAQRRDWVEPKVISFSWRAASCRMSLWGAAVEGRGKGEGRFFSERWRYPTLIRYPLICRASKTRRQTLMLSKVRKWRVSCCACIRETFIERIREREVSAALPNGIRNSDGPGGPHG